MQYLISASVKPYTIKVHFVAEADDWQNVLSQYPDAELIKEMQS